ncbi:MAG: ABC transporter permease [Thermotaleaceae bacterium]
MNKGKSVWILTFSGILLILSFIVLGTALVEECYRLNSNYSMQKVLVSVKNQIDSQGKNSFTIDDIDRLKKELSTEDVSYTAESGLINTTVSNSNTALPARLIGADHTYPNFSSLMLINGSFITQKQEEEGAMVAVIDEELAWDLFKTVYATGKTLDIYGKTFQVTGVLKKESSIIGKLTDDGLPKVYLSAGVMLDMDNTAGITEMQIRTADDNTLDQNKSNVSAALRQIGKDPSNYNIVDYNLKYALMKQGPLLVAFILGIASMLILLQHVKKLIIKAYSLIMKGCKTDYLSNVIKENKAELVGYLLEMMVVFIGIVLIWKGISFKSYIPPRYIPDELIDISYYRNIIKGLIQGGIRDMGYIPTQSELYVNATNMLLNLLFFFAVILGYLLLYAGFREIRALIIDSNKLTIIIGVGFVFSLAVLVFTSYMMQLPLMLDIKGILVTWAFIFLNILEINNGKDSEMKNV